MRLVAAHHRQRRAGPALRPSSGARGEQPGRIRIVQEGVILPTPFLDISGNVSFGGEQGLFSMAFDPDYEENGRFFVNYTNNSGDTVVARYEVGANPDVADAGSGVELLTVAQPFGNHNGGQEGDAHHQHKCAFGSRKREHGNSFRETNRAGGIRIGRP